MPILTRSLAMSYITGRDPASFGFNKIVYEKHAR